MRYQCANCRYRANGGFSEGACPACGSHDIHRIKPQSEEEGFIPARKPFKMILVIVLYLALGSYLYHQGQLF